MAAMAGHDGAYTLTGPIDNAGMRPGAIKMQIRRYRNVSAAATARATSFAVAKITY